MEDKLNDNIQVENVPKRKAKTTKKVKLIVGIVCLVLLGVGIYKAMGYISEQQEIKKEQERQRTIKNTLYSLGLGGRSCGSEDVNTVNYSMALSFLQSALAEDAYSDYAQGDFKGTKREYYLENLKGYCDESYHDYSDYVNVFSTLLLGIDELQKKDIDYFSILGKIKSSDLEEEFKEVLFEHGLSLGSLLVNERDEEICYNMSLRIRLAEDGYAEINDWSVWAELSNFVAGRGLATVSEDVLESGISYEEFKLSVEDNFSGEYVYFDDLTTSGKLVFLYLMPRYLYNSKDKSLSEWGQDLWSDKFQIEFYLLLWDTMGDEKFSDVIE